jgi:hypothetical protein
MPDEGTHINCGTKASESHKQYKGTRRAVQSVPSTILILWRNKNTPLEVSQKYWTKRKNFS